MMAGYAMSRADLVIIPAQGSHLDATEAVKAIKLVKGAGEGISAKRFPSPFSSRARVLRSARARCKASKPEFAQNKIPMFDCQIHEREAYRALFAFGGTLAGLDPAQVANIPAAVLNAKRFAARGDRNSESQRPAVKSQEEVA